MPSSEEEAVAAASTQEALNKILFEKKAMEKPKGSAVRNALVSTLDHQERNTQFIRYTPHEDAPGFNPATLRRVIQMVPAQIDPMMPPKHKHKKAPRGPAEDPVPVLHSPPVKLTKEERDSWTIPDCISNWKNTRVYTIPMDKRLAAEGRGLRETTVNPNFATVSESLYVAERQSREEVALRAKVQRHLDHQEKQKRENDLRDLANHERV